jgi:uncharacterized protein (TIRG00374 family)
VSVVTAERISDGFAVLILSIFGVLAYPEYWPAFVIVFGLLFVIVVVSQIRPLSLRLIGVMDHVPLVNRFSGSIRQFYEGSFTLFRPRATLAAVSLGTISWFAEGVGFFVILLGLGLTPDRNTLVMAVFILSFSTIIGAISALPGGLGAAEASIAGMLVLLLGLNRDTAAAATLLIRLATLWFGVALGLLVWTRSRDLLGMDNR